MKGTEALVTMLERKGVETMFGYPGGSVIPIYDALYDSDIRHVLVRHEQCAAHMADGYARASGRPGVCLATSGPGATNLVTGVATAYADSIPMLALTGQVGTGSLGLGAFQEVDAYSLLMPITKHNFRVLDVGRLPHAVSEAWEICQTGRPGPVHIDLPVDQMNSRIDESILDERYGIKPVQEDVSAMPDAIRLIKESRHPLILVGGGAVNAWKEVRELAHLIGAPVDSTLMGVGVVPSSDPLYMGTLGMHGRLAALEAMHGSDLVISIGSRFSDRTYGKRSRMQDSQGRIIHIDIDPTEFGKHGHDGCVDILCDASKAVRMLIDGLGNHSCDAGWSDAARAWKARCDCNPDIGSYPIAPQKVMHELNAIIDDGTIVTTDVGQNQMWAMHFLDIENPRRLLSSGTFGTMGYGLPAAIGAKAAKPDSDVIAITGDGGFQMVMQEMATSMAEDLPVTVVLMNNGVLGMVRQWQKLFWGERYSETTLDSNPDFVKLAEAFGAKGILVERPGEIADALKEARECGRTCLVEIRVDVDEDVLPMIPADPNAPMEKGRCGFRSRGSKQIIPSIPFSLWRKSMGAEDIEREVLGRIVPTRDEILSINDRASRLKSLVQDYISDHGIEVDMMYTGSFSKGTFLSDPDLDLFLMFPESVPKKEMERIGLKAGEDILHGERIFSEHPYTRGMFEGIEVDMVPCYNLSSTDNLRTAVDRTPFHTAYITRNLDADGRDQVRLLKKFMKGIGAYGAEQDSRGFSGYLCELLVVKYGTFRGVLEAAAEEWRTGTTIPVEGSGERMKSALVVYDPVDTRRNVASAVHVDTLALFIWASRCYLSEPSLEFFFPPARKPMSKREIKEAADCHGTRIVTVRFARPKVLEDVLASQLWKTQYAIGKKLDEFGFNVIRAVHSMDDEWMIVALEMERDRVSKTRKHRGPPVWVAEASLNFIDHWMDSTYGEPFIDDGLWVVTVDRQYTDAVTMLISESSNLGIGKDMDPSTISVMGHDDALENGDRDLLTRLLRPLFPWEHRTGL